MIQIGNTLKIRNMTTHCTVEILRHHYLGKSDKITQFHTTKPIYERK